MCGKLRLLQFVLVCGLSFMRRRGRCALPRPNPGDPITNPLDLYSQNGTLTLNLSLHSQMGPTGSHILLRLHEQRKAGRRPRRCV